MKKLSIWGAVLIVAALCMTTPPARAYDSPSVTVEHAQAAPGETVSIDLTIAGNPGILGLQLTLEYPAGLTLTDAKAGEAFQALTMTKPGNLGSPCSFIWDGTEITSGNIKDGVILTLKFSVSPTARPGDELAIKLSASSARDNNLEIVPLNIVNGTIRVTGRTANPHISITSGILEGNTFTVTLQSDAGYSDMLLLAARSGSGRQSGYELKRVDLRPGENTYQFGGGSPDAVYRVFVLNSLYRPCCPSFTAGSNLPVTQKG